MKAYDLFETPSQWSVAMILSYRDHDRRGFAELPKREIARLLGLKPRRVQQVFEELEAMEVMTRIGPERAGGRNRFVITVEKALKRRASFAQGAQSTAPPVSFLPQGGGRSGLPGGAQSTAWGGRSVLPGGAQYTAPPVATDLKNVQRSEDATASPRLPISPQTELPFLGATPPSHPHHHALKTARELRLRKLRHRVAGLARAVLMNPALGRALLDGDVATSIDALVEATKRLCAKKHVPGYVEVVHAMCTSELFKLRNPAVIAGTAPRPRDRARDGRRR